MRNSLILGKSTVPIKSKQVYIHNDVQHAMITKNNVGNLLYSSCHFHAISSQLMHPWVRPKLYYCIQHTHKSRLPSRPNI